MGRAQHTGSTYLPWFHNLPGYPINTKHVHRKVTGELKLLSKSTETRTCTTWTGKANTEVTTQAS